MTTAVAPPAALALRGIHKRYGDVVALDGVDLDVPTGTVHALVGENGAGKTTLMRVAFGLTTSDAGRADVLERQLVSPSPGVAMQAGIGMVHQHLSLAPGLTSEENLALGGSGALDPRAAASRLRQLVAESGLEVPVGVPAADLSIVQQQRLEILKALGLRARVLILDEPTAVLAPSEVADLFAWIRRFAAGGGAVVLVTHKLNEALAIADAVTVLRRGRVTFSGPARGTSRDALARAMFPDGEATELSAGAAAGEVVVRADHLAVRYQRQHVTATGFEIRRHEIVGVAAVEGSGHRALLASLMRMARPASGDLRLPGRVVAVPADRQRDALIDQFTLTENVALLDAGARRGLIDWGAMEARARQIMERFAIAASSPRALAATLSGGNQQRLVVGRALEQPVDLIVADNPTRGLDLRATAFVLQQLRAAADGGAAVVLHSSDLDEILSLATRVLVVFQGTVFECDADRETIGRAMVGARNAA